MDLDQRILEGIETSFAKNNCKFVAMPCVLNDVAQAFLPTVFDSVGLKEEVIRVISCSSDYNLCKQDGKHTWIQKL